MFEAVFTDDILDELEQELQPYAEQQSVQFDVERHTSQQILGITSELRRALRNLLENALHYTEAGGNVWLRVKSTGEQVIFEVQDTGIGIPEEDIEHIFGRYYRTTRSKGLREGGSGLGLAIVKKITELHTGSIDVESEVNVGTTFRLKLPIANAVAA